MMTASRQPPTSAAANDAATASRILEPGFNCWRIENARRASVLIDSASYFARLDDALRRARRSILIIGWDFDASIALKGHGDDGTSERLGELLRDLVERNSELEIRILVWNLSMLHAPGAAAPMLFGDDWTQHVRIRIALDHDHPVYSAQHQKIVVIDDRLAFVGGIDLTVDRWETQEHRPDDPRRVNADGSTYEPVHDLQMAVDGPAAEVVAELARSRWSFATGEGLKACGRNGDIWPEGLTPDFEDVPVGVARTAPRWRGEPAVREIERLTTDALRAARRQVYVEAQYLTDFRVGDVMAELLERPDGPEIVLVVARFRDGIMEARFMGQNRDRLLRRLMRSDRNGRLRTYCLNVPGDGGAGAVFIHSKLMIVDDELLRIGSANLNNRSTGLDSECDLAIEAGSAATRERIAVIRARLLAEHLGVSPIQVLEAEVRHGGLIAAIEDLNHGARRLNRLTVDPDGSTRPVFGTAVIDPRRPFPLLSMGNILRRWLRRFMPAPGSQPRSASG